MNKTTIAAVAVFACLIAATAFSLRQKPERGITRFSFTAVAPADVDRVVISGPNAIELKRDGDAWKAGDKPADPDAVSRLLDSIHKMESSELETRNKDKWTDMQVDDEKGARVQVFSKGRTLADFVVGSSASGGAHVRTADGVYAVKGIYPGTFSRTRSAWLERRLFTDKADEVTRVEVALAGQKPWALVKQDAAWRLEDPALLGAGARFDAQAAGNLVQQLVGGRALDVLDQDPGADASGLTDAADKVSFQVGGGTRELRLGKDAEGGTVYGRTSGRPDVLTLPSSLAKALRRQPSDLRDLTVMAFDPSSATRLAIARDGKKAVFERSDGKWKVAESSDAVPVAFDLDDGAVARRVSAIAGVRALAEADAEAAKAAHLEAPAALATVTLTDGKTVELAFGAETKRGDDNAAFARGNADQRVYLVRTSLRDSVLNTGLDSFAKRAAPAGGEGFANLDPSKLDSLPPDVRQAIQKKVEEEKQKQKLMEAVQKQQAAHPKPPAH